MRLRDDLEKLAHGAPPPPEAEVLLRRARSIRHRRAVIVPAAAVVAVLVLTITYLSGGVASRPTMTLAFRLEPSPEPHMVERQWPVSEQLPRVRDIMQARAKTAGLGHARAWIEGDVVFLEFDATSTSVDLAQLTAQGRLELRKVLNVTDGHGIFEPPSRSPGPEASTLDEVIARIGPQTWAQVSALDSVSGEIFRDFAALTPREVRLLPPQVQFNVMTVSCDQLQQDPARPAPAANTVVTTCLDSQKLLLDGAGMSGTDIAEAMVEEVKNPGSRYPDHQVRLKLTKSGQAKWTDLTTRVALRQGCQPEPGSAHCRLAFAVDGRVYSIPEILRGLRADEAVITGFYTEEQARMVAAVIGPRELPVALKPAG